MQSKPELGYGTTGKRERPMKWFGSLVIFVFVPNLIFIGNKFYIYRATKRTLVRLPNKGERARHGANGLFCGAVCLALKA